MSKVKKSAIVTAKEIKEGDSISSQGFVHMVNPVPDSHARQLVLENGGLIRVVSFDDNERVGIIREVEKPDAAVIYTVTDTRVVVKDYTTTEVVVCHPDAVFIVKSDELIDAIKQVKGLD